VSLRRIELVNFRIFAAGVFSPEAAGTTVITGPNGTGKTSVLEAIAYLGTGRSFRNAPREAMVRGSEDRAILRAELDSAGSPTLVEGEIAPSGRSRTQINRKVAHGRKDLAHAVPCSVFSPDDLALISGAPKGRRDLLDDSLALLDREGARAADDVERVLRQRGAVLRQANGRLSDDVATTLDVWDQRLHESTNVLVASREKLVAMLEDKVTAAYARLAGTDGPPTVQLHYQRSWEGDLADALLVSRSDDLRRSVNTVGPHRDELMVALDGREARTHASQGEQRCLALALRLGIHHLVGERTELVPTLLLDDVFSELDPARSRALVAELPSSQAILTTAAPLPAGIDVSHVVSITEIATP
jgi:DNA replication and repair protein RecF